MILAGRSAERCEGTDEAIAAFVGGLPHPGLADALRGAKRVSDIRVYERTANFRRWAVCQPLLAACSLPNA